MDRWFTSTSRRPFPGSEHGGGGAVTPPASPTPQPQPQPEQPADRHAEPPPIAAATVDAPALYESSYWPHALSTDGKRVLLFAGTHPYQESLSYPDKLRIVSIDTGKVEAELAFHAYAADQPDPAGLADEMTRVRALLRGFPLGAAGMLATTADGTAGALSGPVSRDSQALRRQHQVPRGQAVAAWHLGRMADDAWR